MVVDAVSSRGSFLYLFKILPNNLFDFLFLLKKYERYGVKTKHIKHALYKTLFESIEEHPPSSIARARAKPLFLVAPPLPFLLLLLLLRATAALFGVSIFGFFFKAKRNRKILLLNRSKVLYPSVIL